MGGGTSELANRIGLTSRRVRQLEDAGVFVRGAEGQFDVDCKAERYRRYSDGNIDLVTDEIERLGQAVNAGLDRLHAEGDLGKRRKLGRDIGPLLGQLDAAMRLGAALAPPHARPLLTNCINMYSGRVISEYLDLTGRGLADDDVVEQHLTLRGSRPRRERCSRGGG
jgi:hypothetical protein